MNATCTAPDCDRAVKSRHLCNAHYQQQRRGAEFTPIGSTVGKVRTKARRGDLPDSWFTPETIARAKRSAATRPATAPLHGLLDQTVLDDARAALARHDALDLAQMLGLEVAA